MFNSQTVVYMQTNHIFIQGKWIQSVEPMAKLILVDAFSVVKNCKNTRVILALTN